MIAMQKKYLILCFLPLVSLSFYSSNYDFFQKICSRDSVHVVDVPYSIIAKEQVEGQSNCVKVQSNFVKGPRVCWLLSYPNSGTSFTMKLVGQTSNTTVATNYGLECDFDGKGENVPLHSDSPHGPYLLHPNRRLPENYILSKTHCGGRCNDCGPSNYLETKESFLKMCAKGSHVSASNATKVHVMYKPNIVHRAVYLIRNPFNNIVSNFHLEQHEKAKKGRSDWLERYPNSVGGFREWCRYLDQKYAEEESSMEQFPPSMIELFHRIPCHKAFYAFAQVSSNVHLPLIKHRSKKLTQTFLLNSGTSLPSELLKIFAYLDY